MAMIGCRHLGWGLIIRRHAGEELIRQLIALGALDVDTQGHGGLFLVQDKARPILRGESRVMLREEGKRRLEVLRPGRPVVAKGGSWAGRGGSVRGAAGLARRGGRRRGGFRRMSFSTIRCCVRSPRVRPGSVEELGQIKGVGASKMQRYGAAVLALLEAQEMKAWPVNGLASR